MPTHREFHRACYRWKSADPEMSVFFKDPLFSLPHIIQAVYLEMVGQDAKIKYGSDIDVQTLSGMIRAVKNRDPYLKKMVIEKIKVSQPDDPRQLTLDDILRQT